MTRYRNLLREYERMHALPRPLTKCERVRLGSVLDSLDELTPTSVMVEQMALMRGLMEEVRESMRKELREAALMRSARVVLRCGAPIRSGEMVSMHEDGKCYPASMVDPTTETDTVWKVVR